MKRLMFSFIVLCQIMFSSFAFAGEDPVYTSFFSSKAVGGYDTVAYFTEGKPVKGKKDFKLKYKGATWYFSSQATIDMFKADPDKYEPQYGGYCAWTLGTRNELAAGDPLQWTVYNDKLYLNYDESIKEKWLANKDELIAAADKYWPAVLNK